MICKGEKNSMTKYTAMYFFVGDFFGFKEPDEKYIIHFEEEEVSDLNTMRKKVDDLLLAFTGRKLNLKDVAKPYELYHLIPFEKNHLSLVNGAYMMIVKQGEELDYKMKIEEAVYEIISDKCKEDPTDSLYETILDKLKAYISNSFVKGNKEII